MKWINVKDRPPDRMQQIDVWIDDGRFPGRLSDCSYDGTVFFKAGVIGDWNRLENVTHWMPLPEPPAK